MKLYSLKLLSVTCEILAQKNVLDILTKHNVSGYTMYEVDGNGEKGIRGQGLKNEKNVRIEAIMSQNRLQDVVEEIARTLFSNFTIIVHVSDVQVLRTEKFT